MYFVTGPKVPRLALVRSGWLVDFLLVFLVACILILPLFRLEYMENWASIESTFIADARFLANNLPHPGWQPLWYCGTRFDYIYPPALRYGTALTSRALGVSPARAYHLYTAFFYALGIAGVYLLVRLGSGSRHAAWLGAAASAIVSPSLLFLRHIYADVSSAHLLPMRLNVLVRYGEGPHMAAFALLPLALAAAWVGLRGKRPGSLGLAALLASLVVAHNFYGATALAMWFPILVWSLWITGQDHRIWLRAGGVAALACGLSAFWLTPSYIRVTLRNMKQVSEPGNLWSVAVAAAVALAFAAASWRWGRRRPERAWTVCVLGMAALMGLNVLANRALGFRVAGEPERLVPELDLALILLALEGLRRLWIWRAESGPRWLVARPWLSRVALVLLVLAAFAPSRRYLRHAWTFFPAAEHPEKRIEARITGWVARNLAGSRVLATGSVRFWFNAWHDLPQLGGGSEQGLLNEMVVPAYLWPTNANQVEIAIHWMQSLGVDAIIVHEKNSEEIYHDWVHPEQFRGRLPVLYDDRAGNIVYRIPRRYPGLARVVDLERVRALRPLPGQEYQEELRAYAETVEQGPEVEPVWERLAPDRMRVRATLAAGQALVVQESFDPAWRAWSGGRALQVERDVMGFLRIAAPPGERDLLLVFETPYENLVGRILTGVSTLGLLGLFVAAFPRRRRSPTVSREWIWSTVAALVVLGVSLLLNLVLFLGGESPYRDSIEGGYASTAHFFSSHPDPWGWNPLQYAGLPAQFTYLPGLPYFTSLWIRWLGWLEPEHVWRIVTAIFACMGPVTVFLFVLFFTRSRWWALATAIAYTLLSPGYGLFWQLDRDRGFAHLPWRLQVLVKYGEGPHNAGLTLLPLALIAAWVAATGREYWRILLAAVGMAVVALTNWVAAMALGWCCLMLLVSAAGTGGESGFRAWRLLAAAALAYLLACFWLTPTFIGTTALNWPFDAFGYKLRTQQMLLAAGLVAGVILIRLCFLRQRGYIYLCFLLLSLYGFAYVVANFYWYRRDTIPESRRYALEAEMFLLVALFELWRLAMANRRWVLRAAAVGAAALLLGQGPTQVRRYLTGPYRHLRPAPVEQLPEYRVARFLADRNPQGRVFVSGGTRFRLNSWFDLPQLGGTFESSLQNRNPLYFIYQIRTGMGSEPGQEGADAARILRVFGVEYVAVHGPDSREYYRDFKFPNEFDGVLERVYHRDGDSVYRVPFHGYAHLLRPRELPPRLPLATDLKLMEPALAAMDDPARPRLESRWHGTSELAIEGPIPEGMLVWVQVTHDPGWRAFQDDRQIPTAVDKLGFLVLWPRPAPHSRIALRYDGTREQKVMAGISGVAWLCALGRLWWSRRRGV